MVCTAGAAAICFVPAMCYMESKWTERMKKAIALESAKYASRSPIPCRWRLFGTNRLGIEIDRAAAPGNGSGTYSATQASSNPATLSEQKNNNASSPYSGQSLVYCAQCGTPRQNATAKFCSSCGQTFN